MKFAAALKCTIANNVSTLQLFPLQIHFPCVHIPLDYAAHNWDILQKITQRLHTPPIFWLMGSWCKSQKRIQLLPSVGWISFRTFKQASCISIHKSLFHLQNSCEFSIVWAISDALMMCSRKIIALTSSTREVIAAWLSPWKVSLLRWFDTWASWLRVQHGSNAQGCEREWLNKGKQSFQHINAKKPCRLCHLFFLTSLLTLASKANRHQHQQWLWPELTRMMRRMKLWWWRSDYSFSKSCYIRWPKEKEKIWKTR